MKNIDDLYWGEIYSSLDEKGFAVAPAIMTQQECKSIIHLYDDNRLYRNTVSMQQYRFGKGEYKYFSYPLPFAIQQLREAFYKHLSMMANQWMEKLALPIHFPETHSLFILHCHEHGQLRPTPLILRYEAGGFNTLHQDMYGSVYFPFQIVFVLTQAGVHHTGGEFVLTEQIPRAQSKAQVVNLHQGDALIFTTNFKPVKGSNRYYQAKMKHGISQLQSGVRYALGIIFHDAA